jgi:hypothetical protein
MPIPFRLLVSLFLAVLLSGAGGLRAQETTKESPFMPANMPTVDPGTPAQPSTHELVGIIATTKQTLVGITEKSTHKSYWIALGKSVEGIEVVSCDPAEDRAVVRIGSDLMTLSMRSGSNSASAVPGAAIMGPSTPVSRAVQAEQEKEARMLVSDLLEIGIQQRKAYEEAQRRAAENAGRAHSPMILPPKPR